MDLNYFLVDVFTNRQFGGNPLAVFPNAEGLAVDLMQRIANELNLSETTFIQNAGSDQADCRVRIFTPKVEMPLAGHPTIGTAWTILKNRLLSPRSNRQLVFDLNVGPVGVDYQMQGERPTDLVMHQLLPDFGQTLDRRAFAECLSIDESNLSTISPIQTISCGVPIWIAPIIGLEAIDKIHVRLDRFEAHFPETECREVLAFTTETRNARADVHCRFFAPRLGVPEDPATGSAQGPLGCYLFKYGYMNGPEILSEQGIEMGRPSLIRVQIESQGDSIDDVMVGGDCTAVGVGTLNVDPHD